MQPPLRLPFVGVCTPYIDIRVHSRDVADDFRPFWDEDLRQNTTVDVKHRVL